MSCLYPTLPPINGEEEAPNHGEHKPNIGNTAITRTKTECDASSRTPSYGANLLLSPRESHRTSGAGQGNQGMTTIEAEALANNLIQRVLAFYNEEMKGYLDYDVCPLRVLQQIHESISSILTAKSEEIFNGYVNEPKKQELTMKLQKSLNAAFSPHRQQNSKHLNRKQEAITKCLQKMMSSYMEQIEAVLIHNPYGLRDNDLKTENASIVSQVTAMMSSEIKVKVRTNEDLSGHINSLQAEVQEYWECVQESNTRNLCRGQLQKHLQNVDQQLKTKQDLLISGSQWAQFKREWEKAKSVAENMTSSLEELVEQIGIVLEWFYKYAR